MTLKRALIGRHYYHELYDRERIEQIFLEGAKTEAEKQEAKKRVEEIVHGKSKIPISVAYLSHGSNLARQTTVDVPAGVTNRGFAISPPSFIMITDDHFPGMEETGNSDKTLSTHTDVKLVTIDQDPFTMDSEIQFGMSGLNFFFGSGVKVDRDVSKDKDIFLISRDKGLDYYFQQAELNIRHNP